MAGRRERTALTLTLYDTKPPIATVMLQMCYTLMPASNQQQSRGDNPALRPGLFARSSCSSASVVPRRGFQTDSMTDKTSLIHQPENRGCKQKANEHGQSGQKPDLLLMRGLRWLSSAYVLKRHPFYLYAGPWDTAIRCLPHMDFLEFSLASRASPSELLDLICHSDNLPGRAALGAKSSKRLRFHQSPSPKLRDSRQGLIQG